MIILTDCDGVLVDWMSSFTRWMEEEGHKKINNSYEIGERFGISEKEGVQQMRHFNMSAEIEWLPPLRDARKYIHKLNFEHGAVFHCITAIGSNKKSHILRRRNIHKVFGETPFAEIDCVARGRNKRAILERYKDTGTIWVEDSPKLAHVGLELGLTTFLMKHDHNHDVEVEEGVIKVNNWKEIYDKIIG